MIEIAENVSLTGVFNSSAAWVLCEMEGWRLFVGFCAEGGIFGIVCFD